jgi:bifunctional non-homologous end joining protein LigD
VVLQDGRVSHAALQQRLRARDPESVERLAQELPATFVASDILRIGDSWLLDVTWDERRDVLRRTLRTREGVRVSSAFATGREALTRAHELGLEAVVAKRMKGRYFPGERTRDWLNIRPMEVVDAVIGGWTEGRGARAGSIGTLLLGQWNEGALEYIGHTGTGLTAETLRSLHSDLVRRSRRTSPFREAPETKDPPKWVTPDLVCRVRHQGWSEGGTMRAPTFLEMVEVRSAERVRA